MKRLALLLATGLAAATVAAGCSSQGSGAKAESGLSIFHTRCSRCHGADGRGSAVFNTPTLPISRLSEEEMAEVITKGRSKMPSFSLELTPDEIKAVAKYIKHDLPK
jgi:mono/diheme cytochrome c family protein